MKVFIIGASGLVGGNCMTCMRKDPAMDVIGSHFNFATNDTEYFNVFDPRASTFDLKSFDPDVVVHTGALTHVDYCETHEEESFHHTVESTRAALDLASTFHSKFIYISSDYVFDGHDGPYSETDKVNPLNVYGKHKLAAEEMIRRSTDNYLIFRITNVYGNEIRGKNFISFLVKAAKRSETTTLRLPSDQFATPINAYDVGLVMCRMIRDKKQGLYHLASDEYLSRVQLAKKVLAYFPAHKVRIEPVLTRNLAQTAPRPLRGGLKTDKVKKEYPDISFSTVDDYMEEHYGISKYRS